MSTTHSGELILDVCVTGIVEAVQKEFTVRPIDLEG